MSERYGMARFFEYGCSIDLEQRRAGQLRRQRVAPRAAWSAAATLLSLKVVQRNLPRFVLGHRNGQMGQARRSVSILLVEAMRHEARPYQPSTDIFGAGYEEHTNGPIDRPGTAGDDAGVRAISPPRSPTSPPYEHIDSGYGPPMNWNEFEVSHPEGGG